MVVVAGRGGRLLNGVCCWKGVVITSGASAFDTKRSSKLQCRRLHLLPVRLLRGLKWPRLHGSLKNNDGNGEVVTPAVCGDNDGGVVMVMMTMMVMSLW